MLLIAVVLVAADLTRVHQMFPSKTPPKAVAKDNAITAAQKTLSWNLLCVSYGAKITLFRLLISNSC